MLACKNGVCMTFTRCGKKMRLWRTHWFSAHSILIYECCFLHLRLLHFFFFFVPWATIRYRFSLPITNTARVWRRLFETDSTVVKRHVVVGYNNVYEWISRRKMTPPFTGQVRPRLYTISTIDIISKGVVFVVVVASSFKSPSEWDGGRAQTIQYYRVEGWVCYYVYTHSKRYYFIFFFHLENAVPECTVCVTCTHIYNKYVYTHTCMYEWVCLWNAVWAPRSTTNLLAPHTAHGARTAAADAETSFRTGKLDEFPPSGRCMGCVK